MASSAEYGSSGGGGGVGGGAGAEVLLDERLKNIEPKMVELITSEIMDRGPPVTWDDIAGLEFAKNTIKVLPSVARNLATVADMLIGIVMCPWIQNTVSVLVFI